MAKNNIKIRARLKNDLVVVKAIIKHPMETGLRTDKSTGLKIPAHHIKEVYCHLKDQLLFSTFWGPGVSKDPYISFNLKGLSKGQTITLSYVDNEEQKNSKNAIIK